MNCMDLLLISNENKSHCVYIKDFNRFICNKTENKNKKDFCKCCLQCFSIEKVLIEHKVNGTTNGIQKWYTNWYNKWYTEMVNRLVNR